jgi:hypothetical protein
MTEKKTPRDMSPEERKDVEIVFVPGCFDSFEGTQEELDELIKEITESAENGSLFEKSNPVSIESLLEDLSVEDVEDLLSTIEQLEKEDLSVLDLPKRTLQ